MTMTVARASDRRPLGARRARAHVRGRNNPRQIPRRDRACARHPVRRRRRRNVKQSIARRRSIAAECRARDNHHETSLVSRLQVRTPGLAIAAYLSRDTTRCKSRPVVAAARPTRDISRACDDDARRRAALTTDAGGPRR